MKRALALIALTAVLSGSAASADIGTATTSVYVRDPYGAVTGSLAKGDRVIVTGKTGGWYKVEIDGEPYRVWSEYLDLDPDATADGTEVSKIRKSKSGGRSTVKNTKAKPIKGSVFEDLSFW